LQVGITRVARFIFSEKFHLDKAVTAASKVAYLANSLKNNVVDFQKYTDPSSIRDWTIENSNYNKLNKLKKSNPEAFFYWYKILTDN